MQYRIGLIGRLPVLGCVEAGGSSNACIMTHDTAAGNKIYFQHAATPAMLHELLSLPSGPLEGASMCKCSLMRGPTGVACMPVCLLLL